MTSRTDAEQTVAADDVLRCLDDALITFDNHLRVAWLNPAAERLCGRQEAHLIRKSPQEIFPGVAGEQLAATFRRVLETRKSIRFQQVLDDSACLFEITVKPLDPAGILAQYRRITDLVPDGQQLRKHLEREDELLQGIIDNIPVMLCIHEPNLGIFRLNRACEENLGWTSNEANQVDFMARIYPDPTHRAEVIAFMQSLTPGWREWVLTAKDGSKVLSEWANFRLSDNRMIGIGIDVRERRHTEARLRASEARFRTIFESAPIGIAVGDAQGLLQTVNPAFCSLLGYAANELREVHFSSLVHPEDLEHNLIQNLRVESGETDHFTLENRYIRKDGKAVWVRKHISRLPDKEGRPAKWIALVADISEQKRATAGLSAHSQLLETIVNKMPVAACVIRGSDLTLQLVSPAYQAIAPGKEMIGRTLDELWPETGQNFAALCREVLETGKPYVMADEQNTVKRHPDDPVEEAYFSWSLHRIRLPLEDGWGLLNVAMETTERKRVEQALRETSEDLNRAQAVARVGSWRLDVRRNVLSWSDENHRIFGIPKGVPLTYETFLRTVHPDDRRSVDQAWNVALAGDIANERPYDLDHRIVVNGETRWVREVARLEFDDSGILIGGFGTTQDITERKLIEQELATQARMKDEFLALLGHELRNPLAAIATSAYLLQSGSDERSVSELVATVIRQTDVLRRLVDDLLDVARISRGLVALNKAPVQLAALVEAATQPVRPSVAERRQNLLLQLPASDVTFVGDEVRLGQVLTNLLDNASKYSPPDTTIELTGGQEGDEVVIRCKDRGKGIASEYQAAIFEPFMRIPTNDNTAGGGLGIGLSLARRLVEMHGGTIGVLSEGAGLGSEFVVRLPLGGLAASSPARSEEVGTQGRLCRALSIALVEDNPDVANSLAELLKYAGHKVTAFEDGPSAITGLTRKKPDVILLDIGLPGMDGYEVLSVLRNRPNLRATRFVAISGLKRRSDTGALRVDFDEYFVKPVDPKRLMAFLEAVANDSRPAPRANRKPSAAPRRVLLVEDHAELAATMADLLRRKGLDIRAAHTGTEALKIAEDFRPALTLCDLNLPDLQGQEVIKALKSNRSTRRTKAVILSARSEEELRQYRAHFAKLGVDAVLGKPIGPKAIEQFVETVWALSHS